MSKVVRRIIPVVLIIALLMPVAAYAQGPDANQGAPRYCANPLTHHVAQAINIDARNIVQQVRDGATLADIITANGFDLDALLAQAVADFRARLDDAIANGNLTVEQADERAAQYEARITALLNGERPAQVAGQQNNQPGPQGNQPGQQGNQPGAQGQAGPQGNQPGQQQGNQPGQPNQNQQRQGSGRLMEAVAEATGLEPAAVIEMVQGGSTLAQIATDNGADPTAIVAAIVTDQQSQFEETLARIEERLNAAMDATPGNNIGRQFISPERAILNIVQEATGLQIGEFRQPLCDGATLAVLISENGGDPAAVTAEIMAVLGEQVAQAVTNGNLTQEEADQRLAQLEELVNGVLNGLRNISLNPGGQAQGRPQQGGSNNQGPNNPGRDGSPATGTS